jgi:hypothetical protein
MQKKVMKWYSVICVTYVYIKHAMASLIYLRENGFAGRVKNSVNSFEIGFKILLVIL